MMKTHNMILIIDLNTAANKISSKKTLHWERKLTSKAYLYINEKYWSTFFKLAATSFDSNDKIESTILSNDELI